MTRAHYDQLLDQLDAAVADFGDDVIEAVNAGMSALCRRDIQDAARVIEADDALDRKRHHIEEQCLTIIATQQPAARDLRTLTGTLSIATELERIGDYSEGIAKITLRMAGEPASISFDEVREMSARTVSLLRDALQAYRERDMNRAADVWSGDDEVDSLYQDVFRDVIAGMVADPSTVREGTYLLWVAHNLERMADRATNIVESVAFIVTGDTEAFRSAALARVSPR